MESVSSEVSLWQAGFLLLLAVLVWLFFRSLNLGAKFRQRQELRHEQNLDRRRNEVAAEAAQNAVKQVTEQQQQVKKP